MSLVSKINFTALVILLVANAATITMFWLHKTQTAAN